MGPDKEERTASQNADRIEVRLRHPPNPSRNLGKFRGKSPKWRSILIKALEVILLLLRLRLRLLILYRVSKGPVWDLVNDTRLMGLIKIPPIPWSENYLSTLPSCQFDGSHISRWKKNFNELNIPKNDYLSLLVDWAQQAECTHDHKLIIKLPRIYRFESSDMHSGSQSKSPLSSSYIVSFLG